ncbi:unnamed protein product [Bursaphelenchus okinawaensis]|uniref:Aminopeptidase n=1 Tax=Bursaphelenchus okinawaensis TaxID=465554 RepID=A0A811KHD7_9BILA|nr:unnamed protein product [Bursaphelenchus okinawaensis]CAG9103173.1 unnamed protein product [Bursaphelenchus okinawaensis]
MGAMKALILLLYSIRVVVGYGIVEKYGLTSHPDKNLNVTLYELEFDLRLFNSYSVNSDSRYRGNVKIHFKVNNPTEHVNIYACNVTILRTTLYEHSDDKRDRIDKFTITTNNDTFEIRRTPEKYTEDKLYILEFDFEGVVYKDEPYGLYLQQDEELGVKLLQSQFSPKNARKAFPAFDEPYYKSEYELNLILPSQVEAISGTKVKEVIDQRQFQTVIFERTPRISTFLLGFAVGSFQKLSQTTDTGVNITLLTLKGYPPPSAFHLESAVKCLTNLEALVNYQFPTSELKLLVTLNKVFSSEAHGLIFLSSTAGFLSQNSNIEKLFQTVHTVCHEISHHYFGDLVGFESWKDLFLSEGLTSYYGNKALEWNSTLKTFQNSQLIKKNLRALNLMKWAKHSVISEKGYYDSITYVVGEVMTRMLASVLGEDLFDDAIQYYLEDNAYKSVDYHKFLDSMTKSLRGQTACHGEVDFHEFTHDFLGQADHPVVYIDLVEDVFTFNVSATSTDNKWTLPLHIWDAETGDIEMIWIKKDGSICKPNKAFSLRNTRLLVFNPEATDFVSIHLSPIVVDEYQRRMESYALLRSMDNMVISSLATQLSLSAKTEVYASCLLSIVDSLDVFKVSLRVVELVVDSKLNADFKPFMEQLYGFVDWAEPDKFDEETEIRRLVLEFVIRFEHKPALQKCSELFQIAKENCRDPNTFKNCHHIPASIRIPVYSAALISDPHAKTYLTHHLQHLKQNTVTSATEWAEIEELVGILDEYDHSVSEKDTVKKCYPINDGSAVLSRLSAS